MDGRLGCVYMFCFINRENSYWNLFTAVPRFPGQQTSFLIAEPPSSALRTHPALEHFPLPHSLAFPSVPASPLSRLLKCGQWIHAATPPHRVEIPQEVSLIPEVNWCWHLPSEMKTYYMNVGCVSHPSRYPTTKPYQFTGSIHVTEWAAGRIYFPIVGSHWGKGYLHVLIDISHVNPRFINGKKDSENC